MNFEATYQKNMQFLKEMHPAIYEAVDQADISHMSLELNASNEVNIGVNGHLLYPSENIDISILKQVNNYIKEPNHYYNLPPYIDEKDPYSPIYRSYLFEVLEKSPYIKNDNAFTGYNHHQDSLVCLLMFGVGNGLHILSLINQIDIKNLIIIDKDFSFLKLSMHTIDWTPIFEYFSRKNYTLNFKISTNSTTIGQTLINTLFFKYPFTTFYLPYYIHYESPFFKEITDFLKDHLKEVRVGLGFYDDEKTSILHTLQNAHNKTPLLQKNATLSNEYSVFIIGSGPSIDNDIEYIKKHKDNVVVISGGSALKILESNGIVPDFHFEMERNYLTYEVLVRNFDKSYLKQINMIGLNVIHPQTYSLFKSSRVFFRDNDAGASLFKNHFPTLKHCNPTVVNAMVSFCSFIGFRNIYLFGADMGYLSEESHHSKHSAYYKDKEMIDWKPTTIQETVPSNFENTLVYTTDDLLWNKQRIENAIIDYTIKESKNITYYNCSNGAFAKGTTPLHSCDIQTNPIDKPALLQEIADLFVYDPKVITALSKNYAHELKLFQARVKKILLYTEQKPTSFSQMHTILVNSRHIITTAVPSDPTQSETSLSFSILRGTIDTLYAYIYAHMLATKNKQQAITFMSDSLDIVNKFLRRAQKDLRSIQKEILGL